MSKTNWNFIQLYFTGDDYFDAALHQISEASSEILIESYIFQLDGIGWKFLLALEKAVQRGVRVSVLADGIGSYLWLQSIKLICQEKKIPFRTFHELGFFSFYSRANKRNHRKTILIDQKILFTGSINISHVHSKEFLKEAAWQDTGVQVRGDSLLEVRRAFFEAWDRSSPESDGTYRFFERLPWPKAVPRPQGMIRLNSRMRWRTALMRSLKRHIRTARKRIHMTNAYFVPRKSVLRHLRQAAQRGVEVILCLPGKTDVTAVQLASRTLYYRLLRSGVRIFEYQPAILHSKTTVIDGWATVGSHNLNHRSFNHDLEIEVVLTDSESLEALQKQFEIDLKNSKEYTLKDLGHFPWWEKVLSPIAYFFRYWL